MREEEERRAKRPGAGQEGKKPRDWATRMAELYRDQRLDGGKPYLGLESLG